MANQTLHLRPIGCTILVNWIMGTEFILTFDQWIDAVNERVQARLAPSVRTQELSWDGAWWVGAAGNVAVALDDDGETAKVSCDGGNRFTIAFRDAQGDPAIVGDRIAGELAKQVS